MIAPKGKISAPSPAAMKLSGQKYAERPPPPGRTVYTAVSMFCGCGGMDLGFVGGFRFKGSLYKRHPISIVRAYDNDRKSVETYKLNLGKHAEIADLSGLSPKQMPGADILVGGFPCQDFSACGPNDGIEGKRGKLYKAMVDYMAEHQPLIAVGENVPHMTNMQGGKVWEVIKRDLEAAGYDCHLWKMHAADYGVPQTRERLILMCVRKDLKGAPARPVAPHAKQHRSVCWAIDDLIALDGAHCPNHGQYFKANLAKNGHGQGDETNARDQPAYTIRSNAKSRIQFHYELPRRLTIRECARIQSFPDTFVFPQSATANVRQIGNAVPPILAHTVAASVVEFLDARGEKPVTKRSNGGS